MQGTKPLSVDGVAIWLATKALEAGMLWMDVAQATRGQYVVRGAPLLPTTVLSAVLRSAFLARVPILVLHSDSPPDEEWASLTRSFAVAGRYRLTEVCLQGPSVKGKDTRLWWHVLSLQEAVPIERWSLGLIEPVVEVLLEDVLRLQVL